MLRVGDTNALADLLSQQESPWDSWTLHYDAGWYGVTLHEDAGHHVKGEPARTIGAAIRKALAKAKGGAA
jgi:hypothetical protein